MGLIWSIPILFKKNHFMELFKFDFAEFKKVSFWPIREKRFRSKKWFFRKTQKASKILHFRNQRHGQIQRRKQALVNRRLVKILYLPASIWCKAQRNWCRTGHLVNVWQKNIFAKQVWPVIGDSESKKSFSVQSLAGSKWKWRIYEYDLPSTKRITICDR